MGNVMTDDNWERERRLERDAEREGLPRRRRIRLDRRGTLRMRTLIRETYGHGEMCPCDACTELRGL